jgi:hypothetical protein
MLAHRATHIAWVLGILALLPQAALADDSSPTKIARGAPEPAAEDELLEYLGSVDDAEGQEWMEYLSQTDIERVVKAKKAPGPAQEIDK